MTKIYIVIPTYNERGNIETLLPMIFQLGLPGLNVVVVDDNSPDGTGQVVERMRAKYSNLQILHRQKKSGLGQAYVAGFRYAFEHNAQFIMQMDADLSHDPKQIPEFLQAIQAADLVLGSRYIANGGVRNWNLARRLISRFGNIYARIILGLPYHDLTGGFKCFRREVLEKVDITKLSSLGYNFQIETTYKAHLNGARITEIPIIFTERVEGKSKFSLKIIIESFWKVILLRLGK